MERIYCKTYQLSNFAYPILGDFRYISDSGLKKVYLAFIYIDEFYKWAYINLYSLDGKRNKLNT